MGAFAPWKLAVATNWSFFPKKGRTLYQHSAASVLHPNNQPSFGADTIISYHINIYISLSGFLHAGCFADLVSVFLQRPLRWLLFTRKPRLGYVMSVTKVDKQYLSEPELERALPSRPTIPPSLRYCVLSRCLPHARWLHQSNRNQETCRL